MYVNITGAPGVGPNAANLTITYWKNNGVKSSFLTHWDHLTKKAFAEVEDIHKKVTKFSRKDAPVKQVQKRFNRAGQGAERVKSKESYTKIRGVRAGRA